MTFTAGVAQTSVGECVSVNGNQITAGHLRAHIAGYGLLPAATVIGHAPVPGIKRVLSSRELHGILRNELKRANLPIASIEAELFPSVCVVRVAGALSAREVIAAVEQAFLASGGRRVTVELVDHSASAVGDGILHFPLSALPKPRDENSVILWRGWHVAADGLRTAIWARVRLSESVLMFVATRDLAAGKIIAEEDVEQRAVNKFPEASPPAGARLAPAGALLRKAVRGGNQVPPDSWDAPVLIRRGEPVELVIGQGSLALRLTGKAESTARAGQRVAVSTAFSRKIIQALVEEKGRAILQISNASMDSVATTAGRVP